MLNTLLRISFVFFTCVVFFITVDAQIQMPDASSPNSRTPLNKEELPKNIKERLAQSRIEREQKEYDELVERSEEVQQISADIYQSTGTRAFLTSDDAKKIDRLEKLIKKVRKELGGDDDDEKINNQDVFRDFFTALTALKADSEELTSQIKKSTRYSISVEAIEKCNQLLRILEFLQHPNN